MFDKKTSLNQSFLQATIAGCGVLGNAIATGILAPTLKLDLKTVVLTARREDHARELEAEFPDAIVTKDNGDSRIWKTGLSNSNLLHLFIIATKPQNVRDVCQQIYHHVEMSEVLPIVLTLCPGITIGQLEEWLPQGVPIVRSMPNTPVMVCQGATGLYPSSLVRESHLNVIVQLFKAISPSVVVLSQEEHLDVVAAISGSGPAYFYDLMEIMVTTAHSLGISKSLARDLVTQSCAGSGVFARTMEEMSLTDLKNDVCVPGGSTRKAMDILDAREWQKDVKDGIMASLAANRLMGAKS